MARRSSAKAETRLQIELVKFFRAVVPPDRGAIFAVSQGTGKLSPRIAGMMKAMGLTPGVSDLIIIMPPGRSIFVEVKTPAYFDPIHNKVVKQGETSREQKKFRIMVTMMGFTYEIVRTGEAFADLLNHLGLIKRSALFYPPPNLLLWQR
jgi:hypothetical protein